MGYIGIFHQPPFWEIRVSLTITGRFHRAEVFCDGQVRDALVAGKPTERITMEDVVSWANRVAGSDVELTSAHLKLV